MAQPEAVFTTADENVETAHQPSKKRKTTRQCPSKGWRVAILVGSITTAIALAINCGVLGWVRTHYDLDYGIASVFTGSCKKTKKIKLWSHLGINVLSTLLLAASNSCMQCLVAPTRKEIDRAHEKRSSIPLHLVYNSIVFDSTAVNTFSTVTATPGFLNGTAFNVACMSWDEEWLSELRRSAPTYIRLEPAECIQIYARPQGSYANVILVTKDNGPIEIVDYQRNVGGAGLGDCIWICDQTYHEGRVCPMKELAADVTANGWRLPGSTKVENEYCGRNTRFMIDYCLAQHTQETCQIFVATPLLVVVIACNFVKLACFVVTLFGLQFSPLITIGDAVESFLDEKDTRTVGFGVLTAATICQWTNKGTRTLNKPWAVKKRRGFAAVSVCRWILSNLAVRGLGLDTSVSGLASFGLGKPIPDSSINLDFIVADSPLYYNMLVCVIIANTPQLIVSVFYLVYNDLLTRIRMAVEWSSFHLAKQTLRVSSPAGQQRSTPFLELPLTWTIPCLTLMTCLHWMISQSIFFSLLHYCYFEDYYWSDITLDDSIEPSLSYSPLAVMISIIIGGVMLLGLWLTALYIKLPGEMPIVRSCSAAISAACHGPGWDVNASMKALSYGSVEGHSPNGTEHVAFCSGETRPLRDGVVYI
ncbi:uncharacterized protein FOBCDRAFT_204566 [Fusarium oxysporum Fo47]|uniref:uncharacterized protein n=1 Tax=Fusarium oxysporum Fo47 TaxID=660027 RepID=UPI0028699354|nr:uncharacterized protein FOBCDRAFT_204566 [Fusarium oxysporum Fo47]WJG35878.1 hypothetical protein FOBCDRAFT_204566 [Fusarium oxysporum Fo47]